MNTITKHVWGGTLSLVEHKPNDWPADPEGNKIGQESHVEVRRTFMEGCADVEVGIDGCGVIRIYVRPGTDVLVLTDEGKVRPDETNRWDNRGNEALG